MYEVDVNGYSLDARVTPHIDLHTLSSAVKQNVPLAEEVVFSEMLGDQEEVRRRQETSQICFKSRSVDFNTISNKLSFAYENMGIGKAQSTTQIYLIYLIKIFTHLKLCLAAAIHNFKWVNITRICLIWDQIFENLDV